MKNTRIYDRVPVKDVRVKDPQIGTRTPQILISRKGGEYLRGDVLDANAVIQAFDEIKGDVDTDHDSLEEIVGEINNLRDIAATKADKSAVALLENGNIPTRYLASATKENLGVVRVGNGLDVTDGTISIDPEYIIDTLSYGERVGHNGSRPNLYKNW